MKTKLNTRILAGLLISVLLLLSLASCAASDNMSDEGMVPMGGDSTKHISGADQLYPNENAENVEQTPTGVRENPFIATLENAVSTFSADVDTASYAYFRKLVGAGYSASGLKQYASAFRTEEFINYFQYDLPTPEEGELFGVRSEIVPCPWNSTTALLFVGMQAETAVDTVGNNLVFLIDVSGSMQAADKLPLLKQAFSYLTEQLTANDRISIVTYSGEEKVVLENCAGNETDRILQAINSLQAYGSTNGEAGMKKAYDIAKKCFIEGGNNRIIMASDGDLNVGISSEDELTAFIEQKREEKIFLSVLGFGTGNYKDSKMEMLADNGNGVYYYIDGMGEAEKVFGSDLLGTLYTVAKDVKLQITFDPRYVTSYRLIGYENRLLKEEDFENDAKDAGDVGAGHRLTVCYELTPASGATDVTEPWMTLAVRHKKLDSEISTLKEYGIGSEYYRLQADDDIRFLSCVIQTVMLLHESKYAQGQTLSGVLETLEGMDLTSYPDRAEFRELVRTVLTNTKTK